MPRRIAIVCLLLLTSAGLTPRLPQDVQVDELRFTLSAEDPTLEGQGPSQSLEYVPPFSGRLHLWAEGLGGSAFLRVETADGTPVARSLQVTTRLPFLAAEVRAGVPLVLRIAAGGVERTGELVVHRILLPETEDTLEAARQARATGEELNALVGANRASDARRRLLKELAELEQVPGEATSLRMCVERFNLATFASRLGLTQTIPVMEEVKAFYDRVHPREHEWVIRAHVLLAEMYAQARNLKAAAVLLGPVVELDFGEPDVLERAWELHGHQRYYAGDLETAHEMFEKVHGSRVVRLADDHPGLLAARDQLAKTSFAKGDFARVAGLNRAMVRALEKTRDPDDPMLVQARSNLAGALAEMGQLEQARPILESTVATYEQKLQPNDQFLLQAKQNLAKVLFDLGDLKAAIALHEQVLVGAEATLEPNDLILQTARLNHAVMVRRLGDNERSRELVEAALEDASRHLSAEHPILHRARSEFATCLIDLGEYATALEVMSESLEVIERVAPKDPMGPAMRRRMARAYSFLGEPEEARAIFESLLEGERARRDEGFSQEVTGDLVSVLWLLGEAEPALELLLQNLKDRPAQERQSPVGLQTGLGNLVRFAAVAGRTELLDEAFRDFSGVRSRLLRRTSLERSPREAWAAANGALKYVDESTSILVGNGMLEPRVQWTNELFELREQARGIGVIAARVARLAGSGEVSPEVRDLRQQVGSATARLSRLASDPAQADQFTAVSRDKEQAERQLREHLIGALDLPELEVERVSAALGAEEAVLCAHRYRHTLREAGEPLEVMAEDRYLAFVLRREGGLQCIPLGPALAIDQAVMDYRERIGAPSGVGRGVGVAGVGTAKGGRPGEGLAALILGPVREALGDATQVYFAPDDALYLLPLDALPDGEGLLGDRVHVSVVPSLYELLMPAAAAGGEPVLFAMGGIDYDAHDTSAGGAGVHPDLLRSSSAGGFPSLPATALEVDQVARLFRSGYGDSAVARVVTAESATTSAFLEQAQGARFLHVATHAFFAPESIPSVIDRPAIQGDLEAEFATRRERVQGLAPLLLCGLALAGANTDGGLDYRVTGVLTAEEISVLDLSACDLAVLSACETSVGQRGRQGIHSLQTALHAAGVRTAITSLWKVPDEDTQALMAHFYHALWSEGQTKAEALWSAKRALRESGAPTSHWAGWVLSGSPR